MDKVSIIKNIGVVLLLIASSLYYFLQTGVIELNNKKDSPKHITNKAKTSSKKTKLDTVDSNKNTKIVKEENENEVYK